MKEINKKIEEEYQKGIRLRNLDLSKTTYNKMQEIRKEQKESYDKYKFFKKLRKTIEEKECL